MNISKKNLELLISNYILNNPVREEKKKLYFERLFLEIDELKKVIKVEFSAHIEYHWEWKNDTEVITINHMFTNNVKITKDNMQAIQEKTYIDMNTLASIYTLLKEI